MVKRVNPLRNGMSFYGREGGGVRTIIIWKTRTYIPTQPQCIIVHPGSAFVLGPMSLHGRRHCALQVPIPCRGLGRVPDILEPGLVPGTGRQRCQVCPPMPRGGGGVKPSRSQRQILSLNLGEEGLQWRAIEIDSLTVESTQLYLCPVFLPTITPHSQSGPNKITSRMSVCSVERPCEQQFSSRSLGVSRSTNHGYFS